MKYTDLLEGMKRFGSTEKDMCLKSIGILPEQICENVIIAPWWEPKSLPGLGDAEFLSNSENSFPKVWNIVNGNIKMTYIKTGIGAPALMDVLLGLGVTPCKKVIFIGSVGSLSKDIGIGDIVIPEYSICGDGASRYIAVNSLKDGDVFGEKVFPNKKLFDVACRRAEKICNDNNVKWHIGKAFSTDTIFAQFAHIDEIINMGCNVIEMETAVAFRAAKTAGISCVAIYSVSDNTVINKSLISGRTEDEMNYRKFVRKTIFPELILNISSTILCLSDVCSGSQKNIKRENI